MAKYDDDIAASWTLSVRKTTVVRTGGASFSYSVLAVSGKRSGKDSWICVGTGKHKEVNMAKQKAMANSKKFFMRVPLREMRTLNFDVEGRFGALKVIIRSAKPGTGIVAGPTARLMFEALGVKDVVCKCIGSSNPYTVAQAVLRALQDCMSISALSDLRGRKVHPWRSGGHARGISKPRGDDAVPEDGFQSVESR